MSGGSMTGEVLLDPTGEREVSRRSNAARLPALAASTVGLLDISKARGNVFLDRLEARAARRGAPERCAASRSPVGSRRT